MAHLWRSARHSLTKPLARNIYYTRPPAAALIVFAAPVAVQTTVTITHPSPETGHFGQGAAAFEASVEAASGGRYDVIVRRVGTVAGPENPPPVILASNFDQLQGDLNLTGHVYSPGNIVGSPDFLNGLDDADRAIFRAAAIGTARVNRSVVESDARVGFAEEFGIDLMTRIAAEMR